MMNQLVDRYNERWPGQLQPFINGVFQAPIQVRNGSRGTLLVFTRPAIVSIATAAQNTLVSTFGIQPGDCQAPVEITTTDSFERSGPFKYQFDGVASRPHQGARIALSEPADEDYLDDLWEGWGDPRSTVNIQTWGACAVLAERLNVEEVEPHVILDHDDPMIDALDDYEVLAGRVVDSFEDEPGLSDSQIVNLNRPQSKIRLVSLAPGSRYSVTRAQGTKVGGIRGEQGSAYLYDDINKPDSPAIAWTLNAPPRKERHGPRRGWNFLGAADGGRLVNASDQPAVVRIENLELRALSPLRSRATY